MIMKKNYQDACFIMPTKHAKSLALIEPFQEIIRASVIEHFIDTDVWGTFSGEVERKVSALECARQKCEFVIDRLGNKVDYIIASEGSFGPHPFLPFVASGQEILYFIDLKRGFHFHLLHLSQKTNYNVKQIKNFEELDLFCEQALFPSHAIILRSSQSKNAKILKGIIDNEALYDAFDKLIKKSPDGKVWIQTDMRANFNPTRMQSIKEAAYNFARRLNCSCPSCGVPGWGEIDSKNGLACELCNQPTSMIIHKINGCVSCDYKEYQERDDGLKKASAMFCNYCNP